MSTINERVVDVRKALGKTQVQFAQALSIGQAALAMIETGKRELSEKNIKLICLTYGVKEKWLRTGDGEMFDLPESEDAKYVDELLGTEENPVYDLIRGIMKTYIELDPSGQKVLEDFARELRGNLIAKNEKSQG